ncbi:MAG: hypothetical protein CMM84_19520 [Rhodothermaceae bacterium]|nr:hypothetical protein [Rhodothermaceae bacterium]MBC12414.1 hypothetical protein [Rhodothermaceae bacterium]
MLNGDDDRLEGFWGMDRTAFLMSLRGQGFRLVTGPTFSVYDDEPASHRTVMMMRHLQIVREAHALGLIVAPTLYWRGDYDIATWAEWLNANPSVRYVSRDFSRTKQDGPFEEQFAPFLSLLQRVGRPLHALVQGVGAARAANVLARLGGVGCTGSVVTASPIVMGNRGSALVLQLGRLKEVRDSETPHPLLAERNVLALMAHLVGEREAEAVWAARA